MMEDLRKQAETVWDRGPVRDCDKRVDFSIRPFKVEADDGKTVLAETRHHRHRGNRKMAGTGNRK